MSESLPATLAELQARYGALRSEDVAALDQAAVASGVTVVQLMEIAGFQVARCAWQMLQGHAAMVSVVVGRGNNGGDGLVAVRHLATWGCTVTALFVTPLEQLEGLQRTHADAAAANGVALRSMSEPVAVVRALASSELVLDGILGTGLRSAPREPAASAIRDLNAHSIRVLAIDIPSGMDASNGEVFDPCVRATRTCTLTAMKAGLWPPVTAETTGELWVADIGMPRASWDALGVAPPSAITGGALLPVPSATLY